MAIDGPRRIGEEDTVVVIRERRTDDSGRTERAEGLLVGGAGAATVDAVAAAASKTDDPLSRATNWLAGMGGLGRCLDVWIARPWGAELFAREDKEEQDVVDVDDDVTEIAATLHRGRA